MSVIKQNQTPEEYKRRYSQALEMTQPLNEDWDTFYLRAIKILGLEILERNDSYPPYDPPYALLAPLSLKPISWKPGSVVVWRRIDDRLSNRRRIVSAAVRSKKGFVVTGIRHFSLDMRDCIRMRIDRDDFVGLSGNNQGFICKHPFPRNINAKYN